MMRRIAAVLVAAATAACSTGTIDPAAATQAGNRGRTDARRSLLGINIDPENPTADPTPSTLTGLGVTRVRFTLRAGDDLGAAFATYDPVVDGLRAAGIGSLLIVDSETVALPARPVELVAAGQWAAYVATFAARTRQIAAHYDGRIDGIEVWNEEDLDDSLPGRHVDAGPYGQLVTAAYQAVHAVSGTPVVVGGLASGDVGYVAQMGAFQADALGLHPYLHWPGDGAPAGWWSLGDQLHQYAAYGVPLWITEWGTNDQGIEPNLIRAFFARTDVTDAADTAYFFGWSDTQDPGFGITTDGSTPKPESWAAFQSAAGVAVASNGSDGNTGNTGDNGNTGNSGDDGSDDGTARASLHGVVRDASNGGAIHPWDPNHAAGITVYCAGQQVAIGDDGSYDFDDLPAGDYGISAVNDWNTTGFYQTWSGMVHLAPGDNSFDIALVPAAAPPPTTGSVVGTVYDANNGGVVHPNDQGHAAGITVYCAGQQVQIAADGTYRIDNVAAGGYGISAVNNWNETTWYQPWQGSVDVVAGQTVTVDIYLTPN